MEDVSWTGVLKQLSLSSTPQEDENDLIEWMPELFAEINCMSNDNANDASSAASKAQNTLVRVFARLKTVMEALDGSTAQGELFTALSETTTAVAFIKRIQYAISNWQDDLEAEKEAVRAADEKFAAFSAEYVSLQNWVTLRYAFSAFKAGITLERNERSHSMIPPPTGKVTIAFTDIEGSTALWDVHSIDMKTSLELHNQCLRQLLLKHGGYEVKTEGDAFMVCFQEATACISWAIDVQRSLLEIHWPQGILRHDAAAVIRTSTGKPLFCGLRVRIGLDSGEPEYASDPMTKRMDYFGPMVNRTARIAGSAFGGEISLSGAVHASLGTDFIKDLDCHVVARGKKVLKGIEGTTEIFCYFPSEFTDRLKYLGSSETRDSRLKSKMTSLSRNPTFLKVSNAASGSVLLQEKLLDLRDENVLLLRKIAEQEEQFGKIVEPILRGAPPGAVTLDGWNAMREANDDLEQRLVALSRSQRDVTRRLNDTENENAALRDSLAALHQSSTQLEETFEANLQEKNDHIRELCDQAAALQAEIVRLERQSEEQQLVLEGYQFAASCANVIPQSPLADNSGPRAKQASNSALQLLSKQLENLVGGDASLEPTTPSSSTAVQSSASIRRKSRAPSLEKKRVPQDDASSGAGDFLHSASLPKFLTSLRANKDFWGSDATQAALSQMYSRADTERRILLETVPLSAENKGILRDKCPLSFCLLLPFTTPDLYAKIAPVLLQATAAWKALEPAVAQPPQTPPKAGRSTAALQNTAGRSTTGLQDAKKLVDPKKSFLLQDSKKAEGRRHFSFVSLDKKRSMLRKPRGATTSGVSIPYASSSSPSKNVRASSIVLDVSLGSSIGLGVNEAPMLLLNPSRKVFNNKNPGATGSQPELPASSPPLGDESLDLGRSVDRVLDTFIDEASTSGRVSLAGQSVDVTADDNQLLPPALHHMQLEVPAVATPKDKTVAFDLVTNIELVPVVVAATEECCCSKPYGARRPVWFQNFKGYPLRSFVAHFVTFIPCVRSYNCGTFRCSSRCVVTLSPQTPETRLDPQALVEAMLSDGDALSDITSQEFTSITRDASDCVKIVDSCDAADVRSYLKTNAETKALDERVLSISAAYERQLKHALDVATAGLRAKVAFLEAENAKLSTDPRKATPASTNASASPVPTTPSSPEHVPRSSAKMPPLMHNSSTPVNTAAVALEALVPIIERYAVLAKKIVELSLMDGATNLPHSFRIFHAELINDWASFPLLQNALRDNSPGEVFDRFSFSSPSQSTDASTGESIQAIETALHDLASKNSYQPIRNICASRIMTMLGVLASTARTFSTVASFQHTAVPDVSHQAPSVRAVVRSAVHSASPPTSASSLTFPPPVPGLRPSTAAASRLRPSATTLASQKRKPQGHNGTLPQAKAKQTAPLAVLFGSGVPDKLVPVLPGMKAGNILRS